MKPGADRPTSQLPHAGRGLDLANYWPIRFGNPPERAPVANFGRPRTTTRPVRPSLLLALKMSSPLLTPEFASHARRLNDLVFSETAPQFFEMMSGALMWDDEKPDIPSSELGWFRAALAYRSSVILGQPRTEFESIWSALRRIAPGWPGFRSERCTPSAVLVEYLNEQRKSSARSLDRLDARTSGKWKPLSGRGRDGS